MRRVIVVGAGVVGLTCAVRLLEAGHRVDVVARDLPLETTSAVAAALWYPYRAAPQDRVTAWSATTYEVLAGLAHDERTGVRLLTGTELLREHAPDPWWRSAVPTLDRETSLPPGYADGWTFDSPVVDMPVHLRWLVGRVEELGGTLTRMNLSALPDDGSLVVNATGLGARHFGADPTVHPVRGQVVVVEQVGIDRWTLDGAGLTYVVPRTHEVVLGGTDVEGEWSRTPDPAVAEEVLHRATALVPELEGARVLRHKVGLRPARPEVRLERVGDVVHCYGHGGAGVTLAWGCADEVKGLLDV
ncbi:FAD-binding oxidoreductase [Nocardioides sp. J2M5]|uniref:FAD-dependent oxidoreductase n=1 Tax=Nocardioides palaemonis TaxID=2829810 RepID=UPI001BAD90D2|nr:FAD-dependent oxidoreductase [Nocardioides palaemonis]MBS2938741.1 FAD-binding oxidoreductase [Nocardioides palaemonis]